MTADTAIRRRRLRWGMTARVATVAGATILLLILGFARPVQAAASWHGLDPVDSVCTADARTAHSAPLQFQGHRLGTIELRTSASCRTAWARLTNYMTHVPGHAHPGYAEVMRNSDGAAMRCWSPHGENTVCWTDMVDNAGVTSYAYGSIDPHPTYGHGAGDARTRNH